MDKAVEDFLMHHGVLGMHWGVRKTLETTLSPEQIRARQVQRNAKIHKTAVTLLGISTVVGLGAIYAARRRSLPLKVIKNVAIPPGTKKFVANKLNEPVDIIHAARGKAVGFQFPKNGGISSPLAEYEKAGFSSHSTSFFKRYGDNDEKVAARFIDPSGRKDQAGRPIFHEVIVPKQMASEVNSVDDVVEKIWPRIKDDYDVLYNKTRS